MSEAVTMQRVLIIDDEDNIVVLCQHLLELAGFSVVTTTEPVEAIRLLETREIDVLLVDIRMPVMDGFVLAERARILCPEIAVVVMTGYRTVETAIKALRSGVDGLVIKPYELGPEMVEIVRSALEQRRKRESQVSLERIQPVFDLAGSALLETPPSLLEQRLAPAAAAMTQAQCAGVYVSSRAQNDLRLVSGLGNPPGVDHDFWKSAVGISAQSGQPVFQFMGYGSSKSDATGETEDWGWSSFLVAAVKRRKETHIFVAAREAGQPDFLRSDLDLLTIFARQAAVTLENARLFSSLAEIAGRVERSQGTLQRAEKMAVQQRLLPALLHEINMPLQAIKNNLYLAGRGDAPAERMRSYLSTGQKELYRLEQLLQRVLALAQPISTEATTLDMEQLITQVIDYLQLAIKEDGVHVQLNFARPLPGITAVREQIEQVLYHLILNSLDAMRNMSADRNLWIDVSADSRRLFVRIEDDGTGFLKGVEPNLFKPFFTTHQNGTGLGLNVSRKIIEAHGGTIYSVVARHGKGAGMEFTLPLQ